MGDFNQFLSDQFVDHEPVGLMNSLDEQLSVLKEQLHSQEEQCKVMQGSYDQLAKQTDALEQSHQTLKKQLQVAQDENTKLTTLYTAVLKQADDNKKDSDRKFVVSTLIAVLSLIVAIVALFL